MTFFDTLLGERLRTAPAAPLLTHYDAAADSRIELSATTLANWAAKVAGLLREGLGANPGDSVVCDLSPHWLVMGIVGGIWWSGTTVVADDVPAAPPVATICSADRWAAHDDAEPLYVAATDPFAMAPLDLPPGVENLVVEARVYPDSFRPTATADAAPLGWAAVEDVIGKGAVPGRVLLAGSPSVRELVEASIRVWTGGGSLVLATHGPAADADWLDRIRAAERIDGEL